MSDGAGTLDRECVVFCRYLLAAAPTGYVVRSYVAAHGRRPDLVARSRFDEPSLELALLGGPATRVADAYARLFAPRGLLRRKLALLLAVLESSPDVHARVEAVDRGGRPRIVGGLAAQLVLWLLALGVGVVLLAPVQLLARGPVERGREAG